MKRVFFLCCRCFSGTESAGGLRRFFHGIFCSFQCCFFRGGILCGFFCR